MQNKTTKRCTLRDVLYVPNFSYSLLSVSKAAEAGKTTIFTETGCDILSSSGKLIAAATRVECLYYLDCRSCRQEAHAAESNQATNEVVWHQRYGHLGASNLKKLATGNLVDGFSYDVSKDIGFCEPCTEGKQHRNKFETNS